MTYTILELAASSIQSMETTTMPMSSIFTAPASCVSSWTYEPQAANNVFNGLLMQNVATNDNADPACFPEGYIQYGRVRPTVAYSPGYCPSGYTSADLKICSPTTTAMCFPSLLVTGWYIDFEALVTSPTMRKRDSQTTFAGCISNFPSSSSTIVTARQVEKESTQVVGPITMWGQAIQIQLQDSDSSLFVSTTTTTTETPLSDKPSDTATASVSASSSPQTSPITSAVLDIPQPADPSPAAPNPGAPDTGTDTSGLSTGAKIGVGVGAGAAGLIVLRTRCAIILVLPSALDKRAGDTTSSYEGSHPEISELGGSSQADPNTLYQHSVNGTLSELDGSSQVGMSTIVADTRTTGPTELHAANPGPKFVHELSA
ncbi:uncharacterized protein N7479_008644 [Penicillium vulpinum]|uniref:uncharacterized protein n=1 Tax=Penicillium vulpinum TaxID=29845 RepID=UPI00254798EC|nr:uncharacterized protein N7479_008644 [Penicillium vulpinum]KAJ5950231.1 hypothetical protein N7479_008644 [Penicillium vulpinum]